MRKLLLLFAVVLSAAAFGQDAGSLFQQAEAAVKNENYSGALELYVKAYEAYVKAGQGETAEAATFNVRPKDALIPCGPWNCARNCLARRVWNTSTP